MKRFFTIPAFVISALLLCMPASAGMSIKEVCVTDRGKPAGIILSSDFKTPDMKNIAIYMLVSGRGILEWIKIYLKKSVLRLETGGQLRIEQIESPFSVQLDRYGRIVEMDGTDLVFGKDNGRMERIGPLIISYDVSEPKITGIGEMKLQYDSLGTKIKGIGDIGFIFDDSGIRLIKAGSLDFLYEHSGLKLKGIGNLQFEYNALGLKIKRTKGGIQGVRLIMVGEKEPCRETPF